jgi:hypothetical protein
MRYVCFCLSKGCYYSITNEIIIVIEIMNKLLIHVQFK